VLAALGVLSVAAGYQKGIPNAHIPGLSSQLSSYLTIFAAEWLLVLLIWLALRRRGLTIGGLVSGRWDTLGRFLRDLGLAVGFVAAVIAIEQGLSFLLHADSDTGLGRIMPKTALQLAVYLMVAATGGFCEELIFRGYLMQQFSAWTGSRAAGVISQGILFGLGHAYYGWKLMFIIMLHGSLLGLLTYWRKSLRPAMLAHGLQNILGGVVAFIWGA
jgi:membrane protease YdiL (CAAX protease family)